MEIARRLFLILWVILLSVAHAPAAILHAQENRVGKFFSIGYDAVAHLDVGYNDRGKLTSAYDVAPSRVQTDNERRREARRASFALFGRLLAARGTPQLALPTIRQAEGGLVIGRGSDLSRPFALAENEFRLSWPATATTRSEWKINSGLLRTEMGKGIPIRDASPGNVGGMYLNAERNLLQSRGWHYNSATGYWNPPAN
jgi:hypothetical protein